MVFQKDASAMQKNKKKTPKKQKKPMISMDADDSLDDDMLEDSEDETSMAVSPKKQKQNVQKKTPNKVQKQSPSMAQKNKSSLAGKNQKAKQATPAKAQKNTKADSDDDDDDDEEDDDDDDDDEEDDDDNEAGDTTGGKDSDDEEDDDEDDDEDDEDEDDDDDDDKDDDDDEEDDDEDDDDDDEAEQKSKLKQKADKQNIKEKQNNAAEFNNKSPEKRQLTEIERKNKERRDKRDSRTIVMTNIPREMPLDDIKALSPNIVDVIAREAGREKKSVFVMCKSKAVVAETVATLEEAELQGEKAEVRALEIQDGAVDPKTLTAMGLPPTSRIVDVAEVFPKAWRILITKDYRTAYATFQTPQDTEEAFHATENLNIKGTDVTVIYAKESRGFDGGSNRGGRGRGSFRGGRGGFQGGRGSFRGGRGSFEGGRGSFRGGRGSFRGGRGSFQEGRGSFRGGRGFFRGNDSPRGGFKRNFGGNDSGFAKRGRMSSD